MGGALLGRAQAGLGAGLHLVIRAVQRFKMILTMIRSGGGERACASPIA